MFFDRGMACSSIRPYAATLVVEETRLVDRTARRNSLGLVVREDDLHAVGQPSIVWGRQADGSRIFIVSAERGGRQGLKCECGSLLVAKQGEVKAWHFAHGVDGASHCDLAFGHALGEFTRSRLLGRELIVPAEVAYAWRPQEITYRLVEGGVVLHCREGTKALDVYVTRRKLRMERYIAEQRARDTSAMCIVLGKLLHCEDDRIADGIAAAASRSWIYNRKAARRSAQVPDLARAIEILFPAEFERARLQGKFSQR